MRGFLCGGFPRGEPKKPLVAFDWEILISDFACNRTGNPKTDFTFEKSVFGVDFNQETQIRFHGFPSLPFDWDIRKRICKTILLNSGLLFVDFACACKTAVLKNCFSNPFSDYAKNRKEKKSQKRYLSVAIRFRISRSIANPKCRFYNLTPDFPFERGLSNTPAP